MTDKELVEFKKENSKYLNNELVKPLNLTDQEFINKFSIIKQMVDEAEECKNNGDSKRCVNESFTHIGLERDENGTLKIISLVCPKKKAFEL